MFDHWARTTNLPSVSKWKKQEGKSFYQSEFGLKTFFLIMETFRLSHIILAKVVFSVICASCSVNYKWFTTLDHVDIFILQCIRVTRIICGTRNTSVLVSFNLLTKTVFNVIFGHLKTIKSFCYMFIFIDTSWPLDI